MGKTPGDPRSNVVERTTAKTKTCGWPTLLRGCKGDGLGLWGRIYSAYGPRLAGMSWPECTTHPMTLASFATTCTGTDHPHHATPCTRTPAPHPHIPERIRCDDECFTPDHCGRRHRRRHGRPIGHPLEPTTGRTLVDTHTHTHTLTHTHKHHTTNTHTVTPNTAVFFLRCGRLFSRTRGDNATAHCAPGGQPLAATPGHYGNLLATLRA